MDRVIGLDVGDIRIGVAVSDTLRILAQPVGYIPRIGYSKDMQKLKELSEEYQTTKFVLGLPKLLNGTEGEQAEKTRLFGEEMLKYGFSITFQDERLSSKTAENILISNHVSRKDRKKYVDKLAATVILQSWLDYNGKKDF